MRQPYILIEQIFELSFDPENTPDFTESAVKYHHGTYHPSYLESRMDLFFVNSISEFLHWKQTSTPPSAHFIAPEVPSEIPRFEDDYAWCRSGWTRHMVGHKNDQRGGFSTKTQKSFVGNIQ